MRDFPDSVKILVEAQLLLGDKLIRFVLDNEDGISLVFTSGNDEHWLHYHHYLWSNVPVSSPEFIKNHPRAFWVQSLAEAIDRITVKSTTK